MPALPPRGKPRTRPKPKGNTTGGYTQYKYPIGPPAPAKSPASRLPRKQRGTPHVPPSVHPASAPSPASQARQAPPVAAQPVPSAPAGTAQNAISPKQKAPKARRGMTMAEEKAINRRAKNRKAGKAGKVMRKAVLKTRKPEARRERKSDNRLGKRPENPKGKKPRVPRMPNGPKLPPKT